MYEYSAIGAVNTVIIVGAVVITISSGGSGSALQQVHESHPGAYHKSRILDEEIAKSKSLKIYTSNDSSLNSLDFNSLLLNAEGK